jgi:hypothetical protein
MKQGIVIVTWSGGMDSCNLLLHSFLNYRKYPIYIILNDVRNAPIAWGIELRRNYNLLVTVNDSFECGALHAVMTMTDLDEFILIQDTFEVKNPFFIEQMFDAYEGQSVSFGPGFSHYFGKFRRDTLNTLEIPVTLSKYDAIQAEKDFMGKIYMGAEENISVLFPDFHDANKSNIIEQRWGRANLVLENDYVIKRKGTWDSGIGGSS